MTTMLDTLALARQALQAIPDFPAVALRGGPLSSADELVVLDRVVATAVSSYGGTAERNQVQVSCYAATLERTLELNDMAKAALQAVGFRYKQSRPLPDEQGYGEASDFER